MKFTIQKTNRLLFLILLTIACGHLQAQSNDCIFKDTLLKVDFGTLTRPQEFNLRSLKSYERDNSNCPPDGYYSYSFQTSNCFNGDWITLTEDHTPNDRDGKMFLVNAYNSGAATFFVASLAGFKPNTKYEFGVWMMNLCKVNGGCTPLPPNIVITLQTATGLRLASFQTGQLTSKPIPAWKRYFAFFTTPSDVGILTMKMEDITNGGCGNDFVMDDLTFRECYKPDPVIIPKEKEIVQAPVVVPKAVVKETKPERQLKKDTIAIKKLPVKEADRTPAQITKIKSVSIPLPEVLLKRENPVIKEIETGPAEMVIELYDNGQVDGDTVSVYHNNELIVSHQGISEKPIRFKIKVDEKEPRHELIMVADNLGSIPPNTSLMIITANGKRYEIFISSSEQKNAKLVINLKK